MLLKFPLFLGIFIAATASSYNSQDLQQAVLMEDRPVWSYKVNHTWKCGKKVNGVAQCRKDVIRIIRCNCMYYNSVASRTELGTCLYTCFYPQPNSYFQVTRYSVSNYSSFNQAMCDMHDKFDKGDYIVSYRVGRFCGHCKKNYSLAVYSYHLSSCIPCQTYRHMNVFKYICIALIPLTAFYFIVVIFRINIASGKLNGFIFSFQIVLAHSNLVVMDLWYHAKTIQASTVFKVVIAIFGPVNLDFFRDVYPKFCISPKFNVLHVLALDYVVALYPFFLICLTYVLIKMYDKNYVLLIWAWKPFKYLLSAFSKYLNKSTSLVETFCTFILLSSVKILGITICLLTKTRAFDETGAKLRKHYLYLDASIEYFGSEHRHFGILAVFIAFTFVFLPFILLLLYPCQCFQKFLNFSGGNFHALHIFMDAFQGCYKTNPTDLRYFSVYYLLLRFVCLFIFAFFQSISVLPVTTVVLITSSIIFAAVQPYKDKLQNRLDILALLFLSFFFASSTLMIFTFYLDITWNVAGDVASVVSFFIIVLFYVFTFAYAMFGHRFKSVYSKIFSKKRKSMFKDNPIAERHEDECRSLLTVSSKTYSQQ